MVITPEHILVANIVDMEEEDEEVSGGPAVKNDIEIGRNKDSPHEEVDAPKCSGNVANKGNFRQYSVDNVNEEKKTFQGSRKLFRCSSHKIRRYKVHPDMCSSESSGHTNSGYMSDTNTDQVDVKSDLRKKKCLASETMLERPLHSELIDTLPVFFVHLCVMQIDQCKAYKYIEYDKLSS